MVLSAVQVSRYCCLKSVAWYCGGASPKRCWTGSTCMTRFLKVGPLKGKAQRGVRDAHWGRGHGIAERSCSSSQQSYLCPSHPSGSLWCPLKLWVFLWRGCGGCGCAGAAQPSSLLAARHGSQKFPRGSFATGGSRFQYKMSWVVSCKAASWLGIYLYIKKLHFGAFNCHISYESFHNFWNVLVWLLV